MPPRGAAAAPAGGDPFAALPHALALAVFSRLTVEQRLRCIEVCRGWRATLADHAAWLQLDLTRADGSACSEALLRAATSRAGGQLRSLRLACGHALHDALCAVAAGHAATLQELRISAAGAEHWQRCNIKHCEALLRAFHSCARSRPTSNATTQRRHTVCCATSRRSGRCACGSSA
jgi:hypothetical protein